MPSRRVRPQAKKFNTGALKAKFKDAPERLPRYNGDDYKRTPKHRGKDAE
jgi:hypothetical protein